MGEYDDSGFQQRVADTQDRLLDRFRDENPTVTLHASTVAALETALRGISFWPGLPQGLRAQCEVAGIALGAEVTTQRMVERQ